MFKRRILINEFIIAAQKELGIGIFETTIFPQISALRNWMEKHKDNNKSQRPIANRSFC